MDKNNILESKARKRVEIFKTELLKARSAQKFPSPGGRG
jgi:hypothetical protein